MVTNLAKHPTRRRRGRPSKVKPNIDCGTPEHQQKRGLLLSFIKNDPKLSSQTLTKALGGSALDQLFCLGFIDEKQLQIGIKCKKIFTGAARSMGIHTRLSSIGSRWGTLPGRKHDIFENSILEERWRKLRKSLLEIKQKGIVKETILNLILFDDHLVYNPLHLMPNFIKSLQSALDEIGKMINKLGSKI